MINLIREDYNEYIRLNKQYLPDGLVTSLRSKERLPQFFLNMAKELKTMEDRGIYLDRIKIKNIVYNLTATWLRLVQRLADEKQLSVMEKTRLINEANSKLKITDEHARELHKELVGDKVIIQDGRDSL